MSESLLIAGTENTDAGSTATADATGAATAATAAPADQQTEAPAKVEGEAAKAEGEADAGKTAPEGAPEKYADFKLPEGQEVAPTVLAEVAALAKELNLPQDKAQKVFDAAAKQAKGQTDAQVATITSLNNEWIAAVKADKEIGGDKLAENLASAKAAMLATSTPQLQVLLDKSGLGNHPEVIRHFLKIAPAFAADKTFPNGKSPGGEKSAAKVLYPNAA